ncbi:cytochrome P450 [Halopolyspora algeriensis]|uniref:Cytochrome P450 n=1 Tax=Halopolyspora algeriensis TaxID=1500506 RepID=A0A368VWK5_9ACTN|nr:cytochrome P450 [Halopolyspora algeriensis]TQM55636.1 cytochrome P450 [Halopolyspora algeriensis]
MSKVLMPAPQGSDLHAVEGDSGPPLVGYVREYMRDPVTLWRRRYEQYGPVSWFGAIGGRTVSLLGPDACGVALVNKDKAFANGPGWRRLIGPFFDRGLMLLDFDEHLEHRRIMQQAFTNQRLARYTEALNPAVEAGLDEWKPQQDFRIYPAVKKLTLDLATSIFMGGAEGTSSARMDRINRSFMDCVQAATAIVRVPVPGGRWRRGLVGRKVLEQFLRSYLPARRAGDGEDLFSALCHVESEDGQRFSDDDVINHMVFLLMAAHDTSTITISTMMQYLGQHPEWQQRCREESAALGTSSVSFDQLDRLVSLDLVMKESMRLVSPVPSMMRMTVADTEVLGHFIPARTMVAITPHFTHHMHEYWPDPERFDPGRFAEDRREDKVHRYAWQPFGGGVHKCLGMYFSGAEIKTIMHHMLQRYEWSVDPGYRAPLDFTSLPYPKDGQPIDLRPRTAVPAR